MTIIPMSTAKGWRSTIFWRETAFKHGLSQQAFSEGLDKWISHEAASIPNPQDEIKLVGENFEARKTALGAWGTKALTKEDYNTMRGMMTTAKGFNVIEKIWGRGRSIGRGDGDNVPGDPIKSRTELKALMDDPRYYDPVKRTKAYREMVDAEYQRSFPGKVNIAAQNPTDARP